MKNRFMILGLAVILISIFPSLSHGVIYFQQNFNSGDLPYNFDYYKFGYTNNPIQTYHDATGGVNNSGSHRIPLGGSGRTNFDVHVGKNIPNLTAYYMRFYLWVNQTFNTDPGANWKLTYNYNNSGSNFVFWLRPMADGQGFQPAFYSANPDRDFTKNQNVPTFYLKNFKGQWICFEYYINHQANRVKLWITTQDRTYDQTLYIDSAGFYNGGSYFTSIKIGAYWDGTGDGNYFKLDEIVISDQYIGPVGMTPIPPDGDALAPPSGLRVMSQ